MVGSEIPLRVYLLSEDKNGHIALKNIAIKSFKTIVPGFRTNRATFEPSREDVRRIVRANSWKDRRRRNETVNLVSVVAEELLRGSLVLHHIDGDQTWKNRGNSINPQQYQNLVVRQVRMLISQKLEEKLGSTQASEDRTTTILKRLIPMVPFYSIETWLYQNFAECDKIANLPSEKSKLSPQSARTFSAQLSKWKQAPHLLDELAKPKENCPLSDKFNEQLSLRWPAKDVEQLGTSYAETLKKLREQVVIDALSTTC